MHCSDLEAARARFENELNEERQYHQVCWDDLRHERLRHEDTEKHLAIMYESHRRLGEITIRICRGDSPDEYHIPELVLSSEAKASKIHDLETELEQERQQNQSLKQQMQAQSAHHEREIAEREIKIGEMELQVRKANYKIDNEPQGDSCHGRKRLCTPGGVQCSSEGLLTGNESSEYEKGKMELQT